MLAAEVGLLYWVGSLLRGQAPQFEERLPAYRDKIVGAVDGFLDDFLPALNWDGDPDQSATDPDTDAATDTDPDTGDAAVGTAEESGEAESGEPGEIDAAGNGAPTDEPRLAGLLGQFISSDTILWISKWSFGALTTLISNAAFVLLTVALLLLEAATLSRKIQRAMGERMQELERYRTVLGQVQQYLMIKTGISTLTGILIFLWLRVLGVEFAGVWGLLAFLLNYVPTIGSILAGIVPVMLALLDQSLGVSLAVLAGYVVVNIVLGNIVEPRIMGKRLGLSPLVVFLCMVFWGWVWGPIGMLLAVPLTMAVKIFFENTEDLRAVAIMMDSRVRPNSSR